MYVLDWGRYPNVRGTREGGSEGGGSAKAPKVRGNRPLTPSPSPPPPPPSPISLSGKTSKLVSRDPAHGGIGQRGRRRRGRGRGVYGPQRRRRGGGDGVGGAILGQRVDRGTRTSELGHAWIIRWRWIDSGARHTDRGVRAMKAFASCTNTARE